MPTSAEISATDNLAVSNTDGMGFTFPQDGMTTIPTVTVTNTYAQGGLTISKTIKGNATSADDEFTFTVTLTDKDGKAVSGTFDTHTFVDGKYSFTLKGGESENFADLPIGVTYTVTVKDQNGNPVEGAAVQMCDDKGCKMPAATNAEGVVTFTYDPSNYHVTIVECPEGYTADPEQAFYFEGEATELTVEITKN